MSKRDAWIVTFAAAGILMVTMGTRQSLGLFIAPLAPDLILATGKYDLKRTAAGGGDASGRFTLVVRKTPAGWKIIHDHSS